MATIPSPFKPLDFYDETAMLDSHCDMRTIKDHKNCEKDVWYTQRDFSRTETEANAKDFRIRYNDIKDNASITPARTLFKHLVRLLETKSCSTFHHVDSPKKINMVHHQERAEHWFAQIVLQNHGDTTTGPLVVPRNSTSASALRTEKDQLRARVADLEVQCSASAARENDSAHQLAQQLSKREGYIAANTTLTRENEQLRKEITEVLTVAHSTAQSKASPSSSRGPRVRVKAEGDADRLRQGSLDSSNSDTSMDTPPSTPSSSSRQNVSTSVGAARQQEYKIDVLELQLAERTSQAAIAEKRVEESERQLQLMKAFVEKTNAKMMSFLYETANSEG